MNNKILLAVLFPSMLVAPASRAASARDVLKHFVDHVHTLSGGFEQVQTDDKGNVVKDQTGRMWISRPGRFRWDYDKPYQQTIVCDGKKIWVYDPDLQQVTVRSAKETLAGSPAALLSRNAALSDAFTLQDQGGDGGARAVTLLPKSRNGDFKSIELWLKDGVPVRMSFHDQLGDTTDVQFSRLKVNQAIEPARFDFTPPKGVQVVGSGAPDTD